MWYLESVERLLPADCGYDVLLTWSNWQKRLIDLIYVFIIDLVDAHNVAIATQQSQNTKGSAREQSPIY